MKSIFDMLVLTPREQRVVIAIVLIMMLAAAFVHHRMVIEKQALPRLKTMDQEGTVSTSLRDDAGSEPVNDDRK
jgi:hypothetical protein